MIGKRVVSVDKGGFMRVWEAFEEDEDADIVTTLSLYSSLYDFFSATYWWCNRSTQNSQCFGNQQCVFCVTYCSYPEGVCYIVWFALIYCILLRLRVWNIDNNALNIQSRLHHTENITTFAMATHVSESVFISISEAKGVSHDWSSISG